MKVSKRDKIFLAVGAGALLLTGIYLYIITPAYQGYLDIKSGIVDKSELFSRYRHLWNKRAAVERKMNAAIKQDKALHNMFLKEKDESLAAAELQRIVEKLSNQSNAGISSSKVMGSKTVGRFEEITIQLGIKSSLKNLQRFLYLIENSKQYLNIEEISLRVLSFKKVEKLETRMKVSGFIRTSS